MYTTMMAKLVFAVAMALIIGSILITTVNAVHGKRTRSCFYSAIALK